MTRTIARIGLIALSLFVATGCTAPSHQATVVLRFQNVRTFVAPDGRTGESEWDVLYKVVRPFHVEKNRFGIDIEQENKAATDSPPGVLLRDYTVRLVVADLKDVARIEREVVRAANRRIGNTGERAQFGLWGVTMDFRGAYISASIAIEVYGRVDPGSRVFIFPHGTTSPVEAVVNAAGSWNVRVQVREGAEYIYGYASHPRSPDVRKCFRVNIYTRQNEPVIADEFDRLRSQQP